MQQIYRRAPMPKCDLSVLVLVSRDRRQVSFLILDKFEPINFYSPYIHQKISGFLMI